MTIRSVLTRFVLIGSILFLFINSKLYSTSQIRGYVYIKGSTTPLPNTNISVVDSRAGTTTNKKGFYSLQLNPGAYKIRFKYIGYKIEERSVEIEDNQDFIDLNIFLSPVIIDGEEISVSAIGDEPEITIYELPQQKMRNIANPLPDALISLKTLPGVFSGNDQSTFYNVRGGNYDENLIYINGVEIYQPLLVRKGIAENPSLVNPNLVKSINLRTGTFPVNYGDKLSSVLDISYSEGNPDSLSGLVALTTIRGDVALEGSLGKKTTWALGLRKINYGYLFDQLQTDGNYSPDFKDVQMSLTWEPDSNNSIRMLGIAADSKYRLKPRAWRSGYPLANTDIYAMDISGYESFSHQTYVFGIQWDRKIKSNLQARFGVSSFRQKENEDTNLKYSIYQSEAKVETYNNDLDVLLNRFFLDTKYYIGHYHYLKAGVELKHYRFDDELHEFTESIIDSASNRIQSTLNDDNAFTSFGLSAYTEFNWQPSPIFSMRFGVRFTEYDFNRELLIMPRFLAVYYLTSKTSVSVGIGRFSQPPLYKEFRSTGEKQSSNLKAQKSIQGTLGFEHLWGESMSFRLESYYKKLEDMISYELWDVRLIYSGENDARGFIYGVDAHLRGNFTKSGLGWLSYSYMFAREDLEHDNEGWAPRPSDIRHTFAATLQDRMQAPFENSKLHIRVLFGSGYHYTWRYLTKDGDGNIIEAYGQRNRWTLPWYRRFDIGFTQEFKIRSRYKLTLREEILNLFNRYNVLGYSWISGSRIEHGLSERTFNLGATVEF